MAAVRGSLRLDGALAGWSPRPTLARAHRSYAAIVPPRGTPTRAPFVLQPVSRGPSAASRTPQRHWWRTSAAASNDLEEGGGNGDSGGGDGGGAGGSGGSSGDSSNEGEDNNPGLSGNMWMLAGAAATVLAIFLVRQKLRQQERPQRSQSRGATPAASSQQPSRWVVGSPSTSSRLLTAHSQQSWLCARRHLPARPRMAHAQTRCLSWTLLPEA